MSTKHLICCLSMAFTLVACDGNSSSSPDQEQTGETTVLSSAEKGDVSSSGTESSEVSSCSSAENSPAIFKQYVRSGCLVKS